MQQETLWSSVIKMINEYLEITHILSYIFPIFMILLFFFFFCRKSTSNDSRNQNLTWKMAFNGSCNSICTWKSKNLKGTFQFRVVAVNNLGFGEYSGISEDIILVGGMLPCLSTY